MFWEEQSSNESSNQTSEEKPKVELSKTAEQIIVPKDELTSQKDGNNMGDVHNKSE